MILIKVTSENSTCLIAMLSWCSHKFSLPSEFGRNPDSSAQVTFLLSSVIQLWLAWEKSLQFPVLSWNGCHQVYLSYCCLFIILNHFGHSTLSCFINKMCWPRELPLNWTFSPFLDQSLLTLLMVGHENPIKSVWHQHPCHIQSHFVFVKLFSDPCAPFLWSVCTTAGLLTMPTHPNALSFYHVIGWWADRIKQQVCIPKEESRECTMV